MNKELLKKEFMYKNVLITIEHSFGFHFSFRYANGVYGGYYQSYDIAKKEALLQVDKLIEWAEKNNPVSKET